MAGAEQCAVRHPVAQDKSPISREYLKTGDIIRLLPISRNTIHAMVRRGELPAADVVLPTMRLWRKSSILPAIAKIMGEVAE